MVLPLQHSNLHHNAFNKGGIFNALYQYLGNNWDIIVEPNIKKFETNKTGWVKSVFILKFSKNIKDKNREVSHNLARVEAKDNFINTVIRYSDKQRIAADKQRIKAETQKQQIESISHQIGKYIPPQIHDALFAGKYDTGITTRRKKLTVFFSDIKNFTSTSENLQPEDLTKYLNEYFSEMTKIALEQGATIDKYIGDAMMVFFGDPESKGEREDARACVEMALRMQERMEELREKWLNEGFADPFQIRIGLNTGYCNVGNFGSDQRLTYTIIGGEVNVAARLESAAEANGILMSYETYAHVQDMVEVEQKEAIKMKGINREIKVYSIKSRSSDIKVTKKIKNKSVATTKNELNEIDQLKKEIIELKILVNKINKEIF